MAKHEREEREKRAVKDYKVNLNKRAQLRRGKATKKKKPSTTRVRTSPVVKTDRTGSKEEDISTKVVNLKHRLNTLSLRVKNIPSKITEVNNEINDLPNRISEIRRSNYYSQSTLEKDYQMLNDNWNNISTSIQNFSNNQVNTLLLQQNDFASRLNYVKSSTDLGLIERQLSDLINNTTHVESSVQNQLREYEMQYKSIHDDLSIAENTLKHISNTSIEWKKKEHPILAVQTQDLNNNKHGIIVLSNFRFLFEEIKEVVIRKTFFIVTEKKTVREVLIDLPIGAVDEIYKGNVGFLKGSGLYIKFRPKTGMDDLKLDTSGNDDDRIIHFYNHIISGGAQRELVLDQDETDEPPELVRCPHCSAPIHEEILMGQTSVKCIYCGTVIKL